VSHLRAFVTDLDMRLPLPIIEARSAGREQARPGKWRAELMSAEGAAQKA
jgi:hypothetical protein